MRDTRSFDWTVAVLGACLVSLCSGRGMSQCGESVDVGPRMPPRFRLSEASIELCREGGWGGSERILIRGNGSGMWQGVKRHPEGEEFQHRLRYSTDDFMALLAEFYWARFQFMAPDHLARYSWGQASSDSTVEVGISTVVDATRSTLILRFKDFTQAVSFHENVSGFESAALDSLVRRVKDFTEKHSEHKGTDN